MAESVAGVRTHSIDEVRHLPPHLDCVPMNSLSVARKNPLEVELGQSPHRLRLFRPGVPAIIPKGGQSLFVSVEGQMIASEKKTVPNEEATVSLRVARRRNRQETGGEFDRVDSFEEDLGVWLGFPFVPMNESPSLEVGSVMFRIGHIVTMSQEDVRDSAQVFEAANKLRQKLWRIDEPVSLGMSDEVAVAAERFPRVEAAIKDRIFDGQRKVAHDRLGGVVAQATDGTGRARNEGMERVTPFRV